MKTKRKPPIAKNGKNTPLSCEVIGGELVIRVGIETLKCCHNDPQSAGEKDGWLIADASKFATDVIAAMEQEDEVGNSMLAELLDRAIQKAKNDGSAHMKECRHKRDGFFCKRCGMPMEKPARGKAKP